MAVAIAGLGWNSQRPALGQSILWPPESLRVARDIHAAGVSARVVLGLCLSHFVRDVMIFERLTLSHSSSFVKLRATMIGMRPVEFVVVLLRPALMAEAFTNKAHQDSD